MIVISAKQKQGFWRCAVFHPFEPVEHADDAFTATQLAVLQKEPMLSVTVVVEEKKEKLKPEK